MGASRGLRSGTRYAFSRGFKQKGAINTSTYLEKFHVRDIVDIVANGAIQQGLPYKLYHGKTGIVYNVSKSAVGVIVHRQVGNRYIEKRLNVRVEHVRHSRSREDFLRRVKENAQKKKDAKANGTKVQVKRLPVPPRDARTVKLAGNIPESIAPVAYETTI